MALNVTPTQADDLSKVGRLAAEVPAKASGSVKTGFVDHGYTSDKTTEAAKVAGFAPGGVRLLETNCGFMLPRRREVKHSVARRSAAYGFVKN